MVNHGMPFTDPLGCWIRWVIILPGIFLYNMTDPPVRRCGYTYPTDFEINDRPIYNQNCCYRPTVPDSDRCVWHVDPEASLHKEGDDVLSEQSSYPLQSELSSPVELLDGANFSGLDLSKDVSFANTSLREANFSNVNFSLANLSGADLRNCNFSESYLAANDFSKANLNSADFSDSYLRAADLSGAKLMNTDFSGADLQGVDFSGGTLVNADLSATDLKGADLTGAKLHGACLSGSDLRAADLSEADLRESDLSAADLRKADFTNSALINTVLSSVTVDRSTNIGKLPESKIVGRADMSWGDIAKSYHNIKGMFSANGLTGKARDSQFRKRRARRREAWAEGGRGYLAWLGSLFSWLVTGYGIRLRQPIIVILAVLFVSTGVYWYAGIDHSIYYSVVTFTTSPPSAPPRGGLAEGVAMVQTFFGTLLVVLLGYVLGAREQV